MIPSHTVAQIMETANIEEVISDFLQLKRSGSGMVGLCPFHDDSKPSMHVSSSKGIFKCFACGEGGNAANFVMQHEGMNYVQALQYLAKKYNIEIEEDSVPKEVIEESKRKRESIIATLDHALKFFKSNLLTKEGKQNGKAYWESRELREDIVEAFDLGYSPLSWDAFVTYAQKNALDIDLCRELGLIKKGSKGDYDAYRGRVIFPIHDMTGRNIAFAGRFIIDENGPKYVNSPESEVYFKSRVLYGLHLAKKAIRTSGECLVTEGYLDVITLYQNGIQNVVASSGTAFTPEQAKLIKRFADKVVLLYDGDEAGLKAGTRAVKLVLEQGMNPEAVVFPEGEDPDSMCKRMGEEGFRTFLNENRLDTLNYLLYPYKEAWQSNPILKTEAIRAILEVIAVVPDAIMRSTMLEALAGRMNADQTLLQRELLKIRKKEYRSPENQRADFDPVQVSPLPIEEVRTDTSDQEKALLSSLLKFGNEPFDEEEGNSVLQYVLEELENEELNFGNEQLNHVLIQLKEQSSADASFNVDALLQDHEVAPLLADLIKNPPQLSEAWEKLYEVYVKTEDQNYKKEVVANINYLKVRRLDQLIEDQTELLRDLTDEDALMERLVVIQKLKELRREITSQLGIFIGK